MSIYGVYFKGCVVSHIKDKFENLHIELPIYTLSDYKSTVLITSTQTVFLNNHIDKHKQILIGEIFPQDGINNNFRLCPSVTIEFLNNSYWGNYVYLSLFDSNFEIFVAQSSNLQVFFYNTSEFTLFSSEISFLAKFVQLSFNREYFKVFLMYGDFISTYTPFKDVFEICGGYSSIFYQWSCRRFAFYLPSAIRKYS